MATKAHQARIARMTASDGACILCGRPAERPYKRVVDGVLVECCVSAAHDPYVVAPSNHSAFVARARKAGLNGVA